MSLNLFILTLILGVIIAVGLAVVLLKVVKPAYVRLVINIVFYIIAGISLIIAALFYIRGTIDLFLLWGYILFELSAIVILVFIIKSIIENPKSLIMVVIVIIGGGIIFAVSYGISYFELQKWPLTLSEEIANSISRYTPNLVGAGLYTAVILLLVAFAGIIFSSIIRLVKS
jgi:hypothetical protein